MDESDSESSDIDDDLYIDLGDDSCSDIDDDSCGNISEFEGDAGFGSEPVRQATVPYVVLDSDACLALAQREVQDLSELLCCSEEVAGILLRQFRWNREKLTEEYLSDADRVLKGAGNHWGPNQEVIHSEGTVMVNGERCVASTLPLLKCLICYEMTRSYTALGCGHAFCIECYTSYISHKIVDEGHNCIFATCPDVQCSLVVSERLVHSLPLPAERRVLFDKARRLDRSYVDDNANIKWCTAAGCGCAIRARKGQMGVQCSCGKRFCFSCNQDDHRPASCDELRRWQIKCHDDSETYNWLMTNTKACPKCQTSIEKNGGCNHMTCKTSSCKFEFCWVCLKPWKEHSGSYYSCNRYDPEKEVSNLDSQMNSSRAALDRYLHYYTRFMNHHNSLKFEVEAKQKMEEKIKELEKQGDKIWMDCNYLIEANDALYECRYALQYTYVYAFYLPQQGNYRAHFEMNQTELEQQTENLSGMLEKDVKEINRPDVVHCFQMAKTRLKNLFELVDVSGSGEATDTSSGGDKSLDVYPVASSSHDAMAL